MDGWINTDDEFYLGLFGYEWRALFDKSLESKLIPCCGYVEMLRNILHVLYTDGYSLLVSEHFLGMYTLCCQLHDMTYSEPLKLLADNLAWKARDEAWKEKQQKWQALL